MGKTKGFLFPQLDVKKNILPYFVEVGVRLVSWKFLDFMYFLSLFLFFPQNGTIVIYS